jgi:diguanylate cyclase (GGDEF)-like protein
MLRSAVSEGSWRGEAWMSRRQGHAFPAWLTLSAVRDAAARVSHFIVIVSDMARLSERHTHLEHMAHHDALTGLPNRMLLLSRVDGALARSRRMRHLGALLFLDLDLFKDINDAHGHAAGDEVLREVAQRLTRRLRESDMAARFGGDEFVVLLEEIKSSDDAGEVARDVINLVQTPIPLTDGRTCQVGASIGITLFQGDAVSAADLVRRADKALFEAKDKGGATFCYFNPVNSSAPHAAS